MSSLTQAISEPLEFSTPLELIDRELVLLTQSGLPLVPEPYAYIGDQLDISADEVIFRLSRLKRSGCIQVIGLLPNHHQMGYVANGTTVWDVDDDHIQLLGEEVSAVDFVHHCYQRPRLLPHWRFNLFAMVDGHDLDEVESRRQQIRSILHPHCREDDVLYDKRILKKNRNTLKQ